MHAVYYVFHALLCCSVRHHSIHNSSSVAAAVFFLLHTITPSKSGFQQIIQQYLRSTFCLQASNQISIITSSFLFFLGRFLPLSFKMTILSILAGCKSDVCTCCQVLDNSTLELLAEKFRQIGRRLISFCWMVPAPKQMGWFFVLHRNTSNAKQ